MSYRSWFCGAVAAMSALCFVQGAAADRSVPGIQFQVDGWLFIPTLHDGQVETFVGLLQDPPIGANITSMWFTLNPNGSWSVWGWEIQDQSRAVGYVKSFLALGDETDAAWPVEITPVNPEDHPLRTMVRGVFEDDPLAEAVSTATDPEELLDFLVSVGWEAARNPVVARCVTIEPWLFAMAAAVQQELIEPGSAEFNEPDEAICQGGGGGGIQCTPRVVIGGIASDTCTGGWGAPTWDTSPVMGGCVVENCWSATVTQTQTRRVRYIYANCTTCTFTQTRSRTGETSLCEADLNAPCPPPLGYVPNVNPPSGTQPCDTTNIFWQPWGAWTPALPGPC